jgi:DNA polymerase III epsilon subunit-like protein
MIVFDIETTGFDADKCAIVSIGALDFFNPENTFYQEAKIDADDKILEYLKTK